MALKDFKLTVELPDNSYNYNCCNLNELLKVSKIESNIPIGSGLGSSAALSVALSRATTASSNSDIDSVSVFKLSKDFEDQFHEGSSGIDTFTVLNGGLCRIKDYCVFEKMSNDFFMKLKKFHFSLIDTGERRKVSEIKSKITKKDLIEFLPTASKISETFTKLLQNDLILEDLINLFNLSQVALKKLKVSTDLIDLIIENVKKYCGDNVGIKITGAGGGGCLLLIHNDYGGDDFLRSKLKRILNEEIDENIKLYYNIEFLE